MSTIRQEFEATISAPPYEHMCDRNSAASAWPGQYKRYETQLAWEMWQAAAKAMQERCEAIVRMRDSGGTSERDMALSSAAASIRSIHLENTDV